MVKNLPANAAAGSERSQRREKEMATHPSILAWKVPQTEEPDGLQSLGSESNTT